MRVFGVVLLSGLASHSFARDVEPERELLQENNIQLDDESLHGFFKSMNPQGDVITRTRALIERLDHDDFREREKATTDLLLAPRLPLEILQAAAKEGNPEVRWRTKLVIEQSGAKSQELLRAALRVIEHEERKGFCQDVIDCAHYYDGSKSMQRAARNAFLASVAKSDHDLLKKIGKDANDELRIYAVHSLIKVFEKDAFKETRAFLADDSENVRLETAGLMANLGERSAISFLVDLLESETLNVRSKSAQLLRKFTDQKFRFVAYGPKKDRDKAVAAWRGWLAEGLETAKLNTGVALGKLKVGRILVCYYNTNRVVEYDEAHNVVWELSVNQPWGCQGLPNGHRLITCFNQNKVIEYDASGKEIWTATVSGNPAMAQRLENGNTLVALYSQNKVVELNPDKKVMNSIQSSMSVSFAERSEDGRTLLAHAGAAGVVEYDEKREKTMKYPASNGFSARRLQNGNVLVTDAAGTVKEYERAKGGYTEVWSYSAATPYDAFRMENGNTLIGHEGGVMEVDRKGKVVWSETGKGAGIRVCYY